MSRSRRWIPMVALLLCAAAAIVMVREISRAPLFECYQAPPAGPFRECARGLSRCDSQGCFQRERAFCFSSVTVIGGGQVICTPTREECVGWRLDHVTHRRIDAGGVCFEAGADEIP
jgi:hypothetical protein